MSKLLDRLHIHHEAPETRPAAPERVPESHEVLEHRRRMTDEPHRAARGVRWLRWLPAVALLAVGVLGLTMLVRDSGTDIDQDVSSYQLVQDSIDQALAANQPSASSYQLVQESIDRALAANQPSTLDVMVRDLEQSAAVAPTSSYQLVQDAIDRALAANQPVAEVGPWTAPDTGPGSNSLDLID